MSAAETSSVMGPALFLGLSAYVMVTQPEPENGYLNPSEEMELLGYAERFPLQLSADATDPRAPAGRALPLSTTIKVNAIQVAQITLPGFQTQVQTLASRVAGLTTQSPNLPVITAMIPPVTLQPLDNTLTRIAKTDVTPIAPDPLTENLPRYRRMRVTGDRVHLREGPSVRDAYTVLMPLGVEGWELAQNGNWTQMRFPTEDGPKIGWMWSDYLSASSENNDN